MKRTPRCSVVIPTYNCLDFLPIAVASVWLQDIEDIEILVVDDASTDGTGAWLSREASRDARLIPLQGGGKGPGGTRNLAISQARAPIIAFLDADDYWWPNKLRSQLAFHEARSDVGFSFTDYLHVDPRGEVRGTCFEYWKPPYVDRSNFDFSIIENAELELLAANTVGTSTVVASRRALQNANGFATLSHSAEDWDLWLRLAGEGGVACSAATTATYLMRPTSETGNRSARIEAMRAIVGRYGEHRDAIAKKALQRANARISAAEAEQARLLGDPWGAARAHVGAFMKWPQRRTARAAAADLVATLTRTAGLR